MCGIAGILEYNKTPAGVGPACPEDALDGMVRQLQHRGPDDRGRVVLEFDGGTVSLGHRRLSILDPSAAGHQPMIDAATGHCVVHNGEVYNFKEIRALLSGTWRSESDTEVLLRAYAAWGRELLQHLRGMFAFALWDARKQSLLLARDRFGIKPLYYYAGDGFFLFASEVRALLASGLIPRALDPVALWDYLSYQSVPAPRTMIQGVRSLLPGGWLEVDAGGGISEGCYWNLLEEAAPHASLSPGKESSRRVRQLLDEAISLHLVSDVPVAAFLSGGIDSSAVVALMREAGTVPKTFSVVFSEKGYDEARFSRQVASTFGTDHTEIFLEQDDLLSQLPDSLAAMDQPTGDGINTYVISRAVRSAGLKVVLSGLGGDELFGGYPLFSRLGRSASSLRLLARAPTALRRGLGRAIELCGGSTVAAAKVSAVLQADGTLQSVLPLLRQVFSPSQRNDLVADKLRETVGARRDPYVKILGEAFGAAPHAELMSKISYAEARTYMHDVLLRDTDQMSMAHGLEVRVPLLDHKLAECVVGLPDACKRANGTPKRLLVESLDGLLPENVVRRPKQGFTLPFDLWMRGALRSYCEERLDRDRLRGRGILRADWVQAYWQGFLRGDRNTSWSRVWVLVVLEDWLERNGVVWGD